MQPPKLCSFQSSSYVMSFTSETETWSRDMVTITDSSERVKVDIEKGFILNRNYTVVVTVITESGNITSSANFSEALSMHAVVFKTSNYNLSGFLYKNESTKTPSRFPTMTSSRSPAVTGSRSLPVDWIVTGGVAAGAVLVVLSVCAVVTVVCYFKHKKMKSGQCFSDYVCILLISPLTLYLQK